MPNEYERLILRSRQKNIRQLSLLARKRLQQEYIDAIGEVIANRNQYNDPDSFIRGLSRALVRYSRRANLQISGLVEESIQRAVESHVEALREYDISTSFNTVPERAVRSLYIRRGMGMVESFKTLNRFSAQASADEIGQILTRTLQQGLTYQEASERIAAGLVQGNEELQEVLENYGLRGGRRSVRIDPDPEAQSVARRIGYNAKRIAITEINASHRESHRLSAVESPVVRALRWTLSAAHPQPDICDFYAGANLHGLGDGLYYPETAPPHPHPFCLCSWGYELKDGSTPDLNPTEPRNIEVEEIYDYIPNASSNEARRVKNRANGTLQLAHQYWQNEQS